MANIVYSSPCTRISQIQIQQAGMVIESFLIEQETSRRDSNDILQAEVIYHIMMH